MPDESFASEHINQFTCLLGTTSSLHLLHRLTEAELNVQLSVDILLSHVKHGLHIRYYRAIIRDRLLWLPPAAFLRLRSPPCSVESPRLLTPSNPLAPSPSRLSSALAVLLPRMAAAPSTSALPPTRAP